MRENFDKPKSQSGLDEQDIHPDKAPSGSGTTGHRKRRKYTIGSNRPGPKKTPLWKQDDWMPNKFGRYPQKAALKQYLEANRHAYAPTTFKEVTRKTKYVLKILNELGAPETPSMITQNDVLRYMDWLRSNGKSDETLRKMVRFLKYYLGYHGNYVIDEMERKRLIRMPSTKCQKIRSLSNEQIAAIQDTAKLLDGWPAEVAMFITQAYPYTGMRPSELRTMKYSDVDISTWTLTVSHPKGEGRYGQQRTVGIHPPLRPSFANFLHARKKYLEENGFSENVEPLIPYIPRTGKGRVRCWHENQFWNLKRTIEEVSGIKFIIKDFRATYCQYLIDAGANIQAVSNSMGHKTTKTTENYYGRIKDDDAIREIERIFMEPMPRKTIQKELRPNFNISG